MNLAIMQPYFFPYLGYWQLLNTVDRFVIYDDVNFIKRGWINRNRILINGEPHFITVPLCGASQNKLICDLNIDESVNWRRKILKSIEIAYRRTAWFDEIYAFVEKVILCDNNHLTGFLENELLKTADFLGIDTEIKKASECYSNRDLAGQERLVDICRKEGATTYFNAEGGMALYDGEAFSEVGISLKFLRMKPYSYQQASPNFFSNLSIIDVLMGLGLEGTRELLGNFALAEADL